MAFIKKHIEGIPALIASPDISSSAIEKAAQRPERNQIQGKM
jgi:hypothetical protein